MVTLLSLLELLDLSAATNPRMVIVTLLSLPEELLDLSVARNPRMTMETRLSLSEELLDLLAATILRMEMGHSSISARRVVGLVSSNKP